MVWTKITCNCIFYQKHHASWKKKLKILYVIIRSSCRPRVALAEKKFCCPLYKKSQKNDQKKKKVDAVNFQSNFFDSVCCTQTLNFCCPGRAVLRPALKEPLVIIKTLYNNSFLGVVETIDYLDEWKRVEELQYFYLLLKFIVFLFWNNANMFKTFRFKLIAVLIFFKIFVVERLVWTTILWNEFNFFTAFRFFMQVVLVVLVSVLLKYVSVHI